MAENSKGKQSSFELRIGAVDKLSAPFAKMNQSIAKKTEGLRRLGESCKNLQRETGLTKLANSFGGVRKGMGGVVTEAQAYVGRITGLVGKLSLLFGGTAGGLFALVHSTANAGDAAAKAASRAGVGIQVWQEYAHVASLCDVSNEELQKSFGKLSGNALKAATGGKEQAIWWKRAGITIKDTNGKIKNSDTLFKELADKVKKMSDAGQGAKSVNLVQGILGEEGVKLMPLLAEGSAGIEKMKEEARRLGIVLDDKTVQAGVNFNDSVTEASSGLRGMGFAISKHVLPFATKLTKRFTEWTIANREWIELKAAEWVKRFEAALPDLEKGFDKLCARVSAFAEVAGKLVDFVGGWGNVFTGVAAIMGGKFLYSVFTLGKAIFSFGSSFFMVAAKLSGVVVPLLCKAFASFGTALMTTPIGWIIAGIAALVTAGYFAYKNWDKICGFFSKTWEKTINAFASFHVDLFLKGREFIEGFKNGIAEGWENLTKWFDGLLTDFSKKFEGILPDWMKEPSGGGSGGPGPRTLSKPVALGPPVFDTGTMRGMSETRTTSVEKTQMEIVVRTADGAQADVSGGNAKDVTVKQSGMGVFNSN